LVRELAAKSDIVIENFKVGGLAAYGLDYQSLKALNPKLIYCSITGFGQTGPYAKRAGYDFMIQGLGGLMSLTGRPEGEEGAGPVKVGVALTDILTGLYSTVAILAALAHRDQTGIGQHVDMALLDVQVACLANQAMNYLTTGTPPRRLGNAHPNIVPYQDFPTADGDFILTVGNDGQFRKFAEVAGQPQWADDPRFATNKLRVANRGELIPLIRQATVFKTTAEWVSQLEKAGVPCGPINDLAQMFQDPQVVARGLAVTIPHPLAGSVPQVASPIRLSETPVEYRRAPPLLGEHTEAVLSEVLGLDTDAVHRLRSAGVL
jgi:crotonobetainyl-CoA:carnitine CoA-transferase CaiB-like acyl-CoA transferase